MEMRGTLEEAGFSPLLASVLAARGVGSVEEACRLVRPENEPLLDPMRMKDMDVAVARIRRALAAGEQIAIYGDYDVDGITATVVLSQSLQWMGGQVMTYIPGRLAEGYGLNRDAIVSLAARGVTLLITVDCGITAVEEVRFAREMGVEVIITDHHTCQEELPEAVAVLDPHRPDCPYPFKGLAGVGVALKLAMAVAGPGRAQAVFRSCRDLAALGTIADVMPMVGENRAIVSQGLRDLNPPRRLGLARLLQQAGAGDRPVTSISLGFTLAPRINAAGRMGQARVAEELLQTRDLARADELAEELCRLNTERQDIESAIYSQCIEELEAHPQEGILILSGENWHQGVVGIVASRLAERYAMPAFMICLEHGVGRGSCRSWGNVNLFELLKGCAHLLENFGGHAMAAGFTVKEENLPALTHTLRLRAAELGSEAVSVLNVDCVVQPQDLTVEAVESLELLAPWGTGNARPVLALTGARLQSISKVGQGRHLKLRMEYRGIPMDAIWFSAGDMDCPVTGGCRVDLAFTPQINEFRGVRGVQLQVVDMRLAPSRAAQEQNIYDRFSRGEMLTADEAALLRPTRRDFTVLWRWLQHQSSVASPVEGDLHRICRGVSRRTHRRESGARTLICLEVLEERGLIDLNRRVDRLQITLRSWEQKVDLESSEIMIRLWDMIHDT